MVSHRVGITKFSICWRNGDIGDLVSPEKSAIEDCPASWRGGRFARALRTSIGRRSAGDAQHEPTSPASLLMCATDVVVPVHEVALRVVPPCPHVKLEERRYVESIWAVDIQEYLTFQNGRTRVVL